jgi:phosphoribosylformimino-5-aminoimidazole carboxamide ribotide isomerase
MLLIPAIDLRNGKCVRLRHGDPAQQTSYDGDPVERATAFAAAGASRLHVVDLDGAFGHGENLEAIARICEAISIPVQTGGGMRSAAEVRTRFDLGAAAVILGTLLVEDERAARGIVDAFGRRVIAGIDARGNEVAVRGWLHKGPAERDEFVARVVRWGISRIIFTEIARDGTGEGFDLDALRSVAQAAGNAAVTASGGARTLSDIQRLQTLPPNVDSCVVGRAIYDGTIDLRSAIAALA